MFKGKTPHAAYQVVVPLSRQDACFKPYKLRHNLTTLPDIAPHPLGRRM